jgi:hypothetical protein
MNAHPAQFITVRQDEKLKLGKLSVRPGLCGAANSQMIIF